MRRHANAIGEEPRPHGTRRWCNRSTQHAQTLSGDDGNAVLNRHHAVIHCVGMQVANMHRVRSSRYTMPLAIHFFFRWFCSLHRNLLLVNSVPKGWRHSICGRTDGESKGNSIKSMVCVPSVSVVVSTAPPNGTGVSRIAVVRGDGS